MGLLHFIGKRLFGVSCHRGQDRFPNIYLMTALLKDLTVFDDPTMLVSAVWALDQRLEVEAHIEANQKVSLTFAAIELLSDTFHVHFVENV